MSFEDDLIPTESSGEGLQVTNFDQFFTYSNGYWDRVQTFSEEPFHVGGGGGGTWEDLSMEEFLIRKEEFPYEGIIRENIRIIIT